MGVAGAVLALVPGHSRVPREREPDPDPPSSGSPHEGRPLGWQPQATLQGWAGVEPWRRKERLLWRPQEMPEQFVDHCLCSSKCLIHHRHHDVIRTVNGI